MRRAKVWAKCVRQCAKHDPAQRMVETRVASDEVPLYPVAVVPGPPLGRRHRLASAVQADEDLIERAKPQAYARGLTRGLVAALGKQGRCIDGDELQRSRADRGASNRHLPSDGMGLNAQ